MTTDIANSQATFVVTLELDAESFASLNEMRKQNFPAKRNFLDAHLTLFHKIDDDGRAIVAASLRASAPGEIDLTFASLRSLGGGVAIEVSSMALIRMRNRLASALGGRLTPQDRQPYRPHVTIQNKVAPDAARTLLEWLTPGFVPRAGRGTAILIWEYLGGPWRLVERISISE